MKSLIIGRGFGSLYEQQYRFLNAEVTVIDADASKKPHYTSPKDLPENSSFDTAHVCTPNYLHKEHAEIAAKYAKIVFIEKPGLANAMEWQNLIESYPETKFFMVKNNMYRSQTKLLSCLAAEARTIELTWDNKNRVPSPGSWFTDKQKAFGGVSYDLMPHLLSWLPALFPNNWQTSNFINGRKEQRWAINDLTDSDYGSVNTNGVYNVDDYAICQFLYNGKLLNLQCNWRSLQTDARHLKFIFDDNTTLTYDFGLCPEYAYRQMIQTCVDNLNSDEFWNENYKIDLWIHKTLEKINEQNSSY